MTVNVHGLHASASVLRHTPARITSVYVQAGRGDRKLADLIELARAAGLAVETVSRTTLDGMCGGGNHQGIVLRCDPAQALPESALRDLVHLAGDAVLLLVLDGVTDPRNLGACMRTAGVAGVDAVVAPRDRAASMTAAARKVASGAAEIVPFVQVTNLARCLRWLRDAGVQVLGTAEEADATLYGIKFPARVALVMGAEGTGLRRLTREHCDRLVRIPMPGGSGGLNVSVAAGVCLFEIVRQRGFA